LAADHPLRPPAWPRASLVELRQRQDIPELLDSDYGSVADAAESLTDLYRVNRWLFGVQASLAPLLPLLRASPQPVTVLDLGVGSGQLSGWLAGWGVCAGVEVRVIASDINPRHLALVQSQAHHQPEVMVVGADGFHLPLADASVDYVISSLLLHHFGPDQVVKLLRESRRVARYGLVMSDLLRHPLPYLLFRYLVRPLLTRSPVTAYDSEASFRRGYTRRELAHLAKVALPNPCVTIHPFAMRLVLESCWELGPGAVGIA
jgi:SAM-dependent methyltransferase